MDPKDVLLREDSLASWRLATLLTFCGFLMVALTRLETSKYGVVQEYVPFVGFIISFSVLLVSLLSAKVKYELHEKMAVNGASPITNCRSIYRYYAYNIFGPYILSPIVLSIFWAAVAFTSGKIDGV